MSLKFFTNREVAEKVRRIELPFNAYGLDPYGVSQDYLAVFYSLLLPLYRDYFTVRTHGIENIPAQGRAMVVGNHSGGLPVDGAMVLASLFAEMDPPRLAQGMVEKFAQSLPFLSHWFSRVGQFAGLPEHAERLLNDDRLLMVFPEGVRGVGKLFKDRYKLERFGTGFIRLALATNTPVIPMAFIGGEEALPTAFHLKKMAKLIGVPYIPVPPYLLPLPMPVHCEIYYGEPMYFSGNGNEEDRVINGYVEQVKERISELIEQGRVERRSVFGGLRPKPRIDNDAVRFDP
ncbi:lysophospholipid acyltransferase family protein [Bradymonas sediminis]|uniref:Acyltransferase n=1 Tax=Bradymonas sediminis TaxID=1548548 RepID=A0A2Z4FLU6_9DELT|nr:lysophospholipid acyltransferase family protein [Bradymonas sediminis]AWV89648.1 acyltransferase [Bradymonas sediminis]TDP76612.1 1-acyl-sn-glycerol-3-phosphate acyltransferase [Bradymonas sediminis]